MGNYQRPGGDDKSDLTVNERFVHAFEKNGLACRFHACDRFTTTPTAREITSKKRVQVDRRRAEGMALSRFEFSTRAKDVELEGRTSGSRDYRHSIRDPDQSNQRATPASR